MIEDRLKGYKEYKQKVKYKRCHLYGKIQLIFHKSIEKILIKIKKLYKIKMKFN